MREPATNRSLFTSPPEGAGLVPSATGIRHSAFESGGSWQAVSSAPRRSGSRLLAATLIVAPIAGAAAAHNPAALTSLSLREPAGANSGPAGEETKTIDDAGSVPWTIQLNPSLWYVAPSGKLRLPVSGGGGAGGDEIRIERLNLDSPRISPSGEFSVTADRLRFTLSGANFQIDRDRTLATESFQIGSVVATPGTPLQVKMEFTTAELTVGYEFLRHAFVLEEGGRPAEAPVKLHVHVLAGVRLYDTSFRVRDLSGSASASADEFFLEPIVGLRGDLELVKDFSIILQVSGGGFADSSRSSYSVDVAAGFQWRPIPNLGLQLGYRQLAYGLTAGEDEDEFSYNGRLAGLFVGITLQF